LFLLGAYPSKENQASVSVKNLFTPPEYGLNPEMLQLAQQHAKKHGSKIFEYHDMRSMGLKVLFLLKQKIK